MSDFSDLEIPIYPEVNGNPRPPSPAKAANGTWLLLLLNQLMNRLEQEFGSVEAGRAALEALLTTSTQQVTGQQVAIEALRATQVEHDETLTELLGDAGVNRDLLMALETTNQNQNQALNALAQQVTTIQGQLVSLPQEFPWTPDLRLGNAAVGLTYGSRSGKGVKIGRLVFLSWNVTLTNKGNSTGSAQIYGVPYANDNLQVVQAGFHNSTQVMFRLLGGSQVLDLLTTANAAIAQNTLTNTSTLVGELVYLTGA